MIELEFFPEGRSFFVARNKISFVGIGNLALCAQCESWVCISKSKIRLLRESFLNCGMPDRIRTYDLLLRKQTLYPAELRAHT